MGWFDDIQKIFADDYSDYFIDQGYGYFDSISMGDYAERYGIDRGEVVDIYDRLQRSGVDDPIDWMENDRNARRGLRGVDNFIREAEREERDNRRRDEQREDDKRYEERESERRYEDRPEKSSTFATREEYDKIMKMSRDEMRKEIQRRGIDVGKFNTGLLNDRPTLRAALITGKGGDVAEYLGDAIEEAGDDSFEAFQRGYESGEATGFDSKFVGGIKDSITSGKKSQPELDAESRRKTSIRAEEEAEERDDLQDDLREKAEKEYKQGEDEADRAEDLEDDVLRERKRDKAKYSDERDQRIQEYLADRQSQIGTEKELDQMMAEVKNAPSTVREAVRQAEEESLRNNAALAASLPTRFGGSSARSLLDQQREQSLNIAQGSAVGQLQESEGRRDLISRLLGQKQTSQAARQQLAIQGGQQALTGQQVATQSLAPILNVAGTARTNERFGKQIGLSQIGLGLQATDSAHSNILGGLQSNLQQAQWFNELDQQKRKEIMDWANAGVGLGTGLLTGGAKVSK